MLTRPPAGLARLGVILAALSLFAITFREGIERGYDQTIPIGTVSRVALAISSYLTEMVYQEHGYVLDSTIFHKLESRGISRDPDVVARLGMKVPENLKNAVFIDEILDSMVRDIPNYPARPDLSGFGTDDVGLVTFTKLAFFLFGRHVRAFYYLFFLIYGATVITALIERRDSPLSQCAIIGFMAVMYIFFFHSPQFLNTKSDALGTVWSPHFITQLGVIPLLHIVLMMINRVPFTASKLSAVAFQSLIVAFVLHIRATGVYLPIVLSVIAVGYCLLEWMNAHREKIHVSILSILKPSWPAFVSIAIVILFIQVSLSARHRVYLQEGGLGYHTYWHSIYYALQMHPQFYKRFGAMHENLTGDAMPIAAIRHYLKEHPEVDKPEIYRPTGGFKSGHMDRLARLAFMDFVSQHPKFVLETFVKYKAPVMFEYIAETISAEWAHLSSSSRGAAIVAALLAAAWLSRRPEETRIYLQFTVCVCIMALAAFGMIFLTVPGLNDPETILAVQFAALLLLILGLSRAFRRVHVPAAGRRGRGPTFSSQYMYVSWPWPRLG